MTTINANAPAAVDLGAIETMTPEQLKAALLKAQTDNAVLAKAAAEAKKPGVFSARVNEVGKKGSNGEVTKGGNVSLVGLTTKFPITLYGSQLITLTDPENILTALDVAIAGQHHLSVKGNTDAEKAVARATMEAGLKARRAVYAQVVEAIRKNAKKT